MEARSTQPPASRSSRDDVFEAAMADQKEAV